MDRIAAVLAVNGEVPRRCVLPATGGIGNKTMYPELDEVDLLSRVAEICRESLRLSCYPRHTAELLDLALTTNSPGAWEAAKDDVLTGDLNPEGATACFRRGCNAAIAVGCLVGAQSFEHLANIGMVLSHVLKSLDEESRAEMGQALSCQLRGVMDTFTKFSQFTNRDVREKVLRGFGKLMKLARPPGDLVLNELARYVLGQKQESLLHFFLSLPSISFANDPDLARLLLQRAQELPSDVLTRYPPMALLARVTIEYPQAVQSIRTQLCQMACELLRDSSVLDSRMCVMAALLVEETSGNQLNKVLANALRACSSTLLTKQTER
jgi:hypothetical protein